tara:strand:- start:33 stop:353 length:321 start_codon:yes stop_codon:yes gene_type:complete
MKKDNIYMTDEQLTIIADKVVTKMMKLKTMETWFKDIESAASRNDVDEEYQELQLDEEATAYGELAKLMTLMDICKQDEAYEKCAIINKRLKHINKIISKYNDDKN